MSAFHRQTSQQKFQCAVAPRAGGAGKFCECLHSFGDAETRSGPGSPETAILVRIGEQGVQLRPGIARVRARQSCARREQHQRRPGRRELPRGAQLVHPATSATGGNAEPACARDAAYQAAGSITAAACVRRPRRARKPGRAKVVRWIDKLGRRLRWLALGSIDDLVEPAWAVAFHREDARDEVAAAPPSSSSSCQAHSRLRPDPPHPHDAGLDPFVELDEVGKPEVAAPTALSRY